MMLTAEQLNDHPLPFAKLMGVRFVTVSKDEVVVELEVRPDLCTAPMPILHGGAAMALADTAGAVATVMNLPEGAKGTTTIESKTNFIAAAQSGTTVRAQRRRFTAAAKPKSGKPASPAPTANSSPSSRKRSWCFRGVRPTGRR